VGSNVYEYRQPWLLVGVEGVCFNPIQPRLS
jgi:hypothetical protein